MTDKRTKKQPDRYTYTDCLSDVAPYPTKENGTTLYQLLMAGCLVTLVVTVNGVRASGASFFEHSR